MRSASDVVVASAIAAVTFAILAGYSVVLASAYAVAFTYVSVLLMLMG